MRLFSIHDSKAERFLEPFFAPTEAVAIRFVEAAVHKPDHNFNRNSEDYTLFEIAVFNDEDGTIDPLVPRAITNLLHLLPQDTPDMGAYVARVPLKETA